MRKTFTKIICFTAAAVLSLGVALVSACSNYNTKPLSDTPSADAAVSSNGGFAVEKGDYVYFINGKESNTADNTFGNVVKGAIMRISKSDLAARNYSNVDTVVPLVTYSGNSNAGIFIYGDTIYYSTPSTEKNSDGEVQYSYLAFKSTKLDGTGTMKDYYVQYSNNAVEYRYVEVDGTVYLVYVATSENLYGTSYTNIHSVNTSTGENTLLAYNVSDVIFDGADLTNPRIYYTMNVTDFATGTTFSNYNQIYTVTADTTTSPKDYDISSIVDDYDPDEDPLYVNCGTLVFDGIGKVEGMTDSITIFNGDDADKVDRSAYTYTLSSYENGTLFYTRTSTQNSSAMLFSAAESEILSTGWNPVLGNPDYNDCLITDVSAVANYTYLFDGDEIESILIADSTGLMKATVTDGKIATDTDNENKFYLTSDGQATVLFTARHNGLNYIYYSLTGGNGYTVYRICYDGTYTDYNGLSVEDDVTEYTSVRILDLDSSSDWYLPEMVEGQILFPTQTENMTSYVYIMACDLNKDGKVMTNAQIDALNDMYESVSEKIGETDEDVYENLTDALTYAFFTGDSSYIGELVDAYVAEGYDEEYIWSKESIAKYQEFIEATADGEWGEFSATVKVNGVEVAANKRDYYYSLLGKMNDADAEAYDELLKTTYLQAYPEQDGGWFANLSTGAKVGFVIGVCAGGLVIIAAAVLVAIIVVRKRREKLPEYDKQHIKVDTTDDKDIDVYSDDEDESDESDESDGPDGGEDGE